MTSFSLSVNDETAEFDVRQNGDTITVTHQDQTAVFKIVAADGPVINLEQQMPDGRCRRVSLAGMVDGDQRYIWANGRYIQARLLRRRQHESVDESPGSLMSAIPAVVTKILVNVGDTVHAGDKLMLLESMKMVIPIQAPHDGRVTAVHCRAGESVPAGVLLIALGPIDQT